MSLPKIPAFTASASIRPTAEQFAAQSQYGLTQGIHPQATICDTPRDICEYICCDFRSGPFGIPVPVSCTSDWICGHRSPNRL